MLQEFTTVAHTYWTQFLFVLPRLLVATVPLTVVWLAAERLRNFLSAKLAARSAGPLLTNFLTQVERWLLVLGGLLLALQIIGFSGVVGGLLGGWGCRPFWWALPSRTLPRTSWPASFWPSTGPSMSTIAFR